MIPLGGWLAIAQERSPALQHAWFRRLTSRRLVRVRCPVCSRMLHLIVKTKHHARCKCDTLFSFSIMPWQPAWAKR